MVWDVTPQDEAGASPPQLALQHSHSEALAAQEPDWDKEQEQYQAVLLNGGQVLLTTFHRSDDNSIDQVKIPMVPLGRVWDYYMQVPDTAWLAESEKVEASSVQSWLRQISADAWYGGQCTIKDAGDSTAPSFTSACHTAFLPIAIGEVVTTISPPLIVWADVRRLTGGWCVLATTCIEDRTPNVDITTTGLVPLAALVEQPQA